MKAFAPANVSCIFRIYRHKGKRGSLGVGFTLKKGVVASVKKGKQVVMINGKRASFPTVKEVVKRLTNEPVGVALKSDFPFGCGFGMSGASALAVAFAVNKLLKLGKAKRELGLIAHESEVKHRTGLGDVGGQFTGGVMIKKNKADPLSVRRLACKQDAIYYRVFGPIETKKIINSKRKEFLINKAGDKALKKINNGSFERLVEISKQFAVESGLLRHAQVKRIIHSVEQKGGRASMIMLGNAVFSTLSFAGSKKAYISKKGAYLL
ncbi:GHMP kinase [Candidatus Woesearchaeota archaeon]|nr:GHMP kinase [Candidatus Woesearchaeota archaeon]